MSISEWFTGESMDIPPVPLNNYSPNELPITPSGKTFPLLNTDTNYSVHQMNYVQKTQYVQPMDGNYDMNSSAYPYSSYQPHNPQEQYTQQQSVYYQPMGCNVSQPKHQSYQHANPPQPLLHRSSELEQLVGSQLLAEVHQLIERARVLYSGLMLESPITVETSHSLLNALTHGKDLLMSILYHWSLRQQRVSIGSQWTQQAH